MAKDNAFEVQYSTDWLETPLKSLAPVDSALRCQVCKDFYTTPMITSCSHTFCSICIRRCLNNDGKCPTCRADERELKLRFNGAIEELVEAFKNARPEVLEFARRPVAMESSHTKRGIEDGLEAVESPPKKKTRSSGRTMKSTQNVVVLDSDNDDDDYIAEEGFVQCPICEKFIKQESINAHLDRNCVDDPPRVMAGLNKSGTTSLQSPSRSDKPRPERLPHVNYSMMKDNALKKKLIDQGLSAAGSRQLLEKRYTEWLTLWNANCDATKPKTKNELKRDLETWERTHGSRAATISKQESGAHIRDKDFDGHAWSSKHDDSFRQLIANARRKPPSKPQTADSSSNPSMGDSSKTTVQEPTLAENPEDMGMAEDEELPTMQLFAELQQDTLPTRLNGSQRRFFEDGASELPRT